MSFITIPNGRIYNPPVPPVSPIGFRRYCDGNVFCQEGFVGRNCNLRQPRCDPAPPRPAARGLDNGATGPWPGHPSYVGPVAVAPVPARPQPAVPSSWAGPMSSGEIGGSRNKRNRKTKNRKRKVKRSHKNRK